VTCPQVYRTWFGSNLSIPILDQHMTEFTDWLHYIITTKDEAIIIQIATLIYHIWLAQNIKVFEEKDLPEADIIHLVDTSI